MSHSTPESLWKNGVCLGSAFFGGVLGNLAASLTWEGGKFFLKPLLDKVPTLTELLAHGGSSQNHDILRALRKAECEALIAVIDETLLTDFDMRSGKGGIRERISARILERQEPSFASLCRLRRTFRDISGVIARMPLEDLAHMSIGSTQLADVPAIVKSGRETLAAESVDELRNQSTAVYLKALEWAIQPDQLPEVFKTRFRDPQKGWFALFRLSFREELKNNEKARIAFELDCQSLLPNLLGQGFSVVDKYLAAHDARLATLLTELRGFRDSLDSEVGKVLTLLEGISSTTQETHALVQDLHAHSIKRDKAPLPFPQTVRDAINQGIGCINQGHFKKAVTEFQQALQIAEELKHSLAIVDAKQHLALALTQTDEDGTEAKALLAECLAALAVEDDQKQRASVLDSLARLHEGEGDFETAESLLRQSLAINDKLADKSAQAGTLVNLAWTVGRCGRTEEALLLNKRGYELAAQALNEVKPDDTEHTSFLHTILGNLFFQRSKIHQRRAEPDEAETALETALQWQRKIEPNHELAKLLRALAELKLFKQQLQDGVTLLGEAATLYQKLEMLAEFASCIHVMGQVYASVGKTEKAGEFFTAAGSVAARSGRNQIAADILMSLARLAQQQNDLAGAFRQYTEAFDSSDRREFKAECCMALGELAKKQGNTEERKRHLDKASVLLRAEIAATRNDLKRAGLNFVLGNCLRDAERLNEALCHVRKAGDGFRVAGDSYGLAKATFEMAGLLDHLGRKDDARRTCREVQEMVAGKPFFDISAAVALSMAHFDFHDRNWADASRLIEECLQLCKAHDLPLYPDALRFKDELATAKQTGTETGASIESLLDSLHEQLVLVPSNREGYVRLWAFCHARYLGSALNATLGPNIAVMVEDFEEFTRVSALLKPYRDWSFAIPPGTYPENIAETVPITDKMLIPAHGIGYSLVREREPPDAMEHGDDAIEATSMKRLGMSPESRAFFTVANVSTGGAVPRYYFCTLGEDAEQDAGTKTGVYGEALALPPLFHELLQPRRILEVKRERLFFIYYNRGALEEGRVFWHDMAILRTLHCLPVYQSSLPRADNVHLVSSCSVALPVLTDADMSTHKKALRGIRTAMLELLSVSEETAAGKLAHLAADAEDLASAVEGRDMLHLRFCVLRFEQDHSMRIGAAIVMG